MIEHPWPKDRREFTEVEWGEIALSVLLAVRAQPADRKLTYTIDKQNRVTVTAAHWILRITPPTPQQPAATFHAQHKPGSEHSAPPAAARFIWHDVELHRELVLNAAAQYSVDLQRELNKLEQKHDPAWKDAAA